VAKAPIFLRESLTSERLDRPILILSIYFGS
jgi:hypothetical protein